VGQQRIQGDQNVQIQGVVGSRIEINYNGATRTVPLEPAHVPVAAKLPSPARLVRAHSGIVPYVERAGLLTELEAWIDSPAPFAGQVIGGRGGTGKTRLAVELCLRVQKSEWLCGFLSRITDPGMLEALVEAPTARLVVIDYAETRPEKVELLLPLLSAKATQQSPVRVLLLVRDSSDSGGDWAARLAGGSMRSTRCWTNARSATWRMRRSVSQSGESSSRLRFLPWPCIYRDLQPPRPHRI
jgi:hypothetical protein